MTITSARTRRTRLSGICNIRYGRAVVLIFVPHFDGGMYQLCLVPMMGDSRREVIASLDSILLLLSLSLGLYEENVSSVQ